MFRALNKTAPEIEIWLDGEALAVPAGISVAAALFMLNQLPTRHSAVSHSPRAPHCMMGSCFECLLEIDGVNQRACMVEVEAGMQLRRNFGADESEPRS